MLKREHCRFCEQRLRSLSGISDVSGQMDKQVCIGIFGQRGSRCAEMNRFDKKRDVFFRRLTDRLSGHSRTRSTPTG